MSDEKLLQLNQKRRELEAEHNRTGVLDALKCDALIASYRGIGATNNADKLREKLDAYTVGEVTG